MADSFCFKKIKTKSEDETPPPKKHLTPKQALDLEPDLTFSECSCSDTEDESSTTDYSEDECTSENIMEEVQNNWKNWSPMKWYQFPFTNHECLLLPITNHEPIDYFHHVLNQKFLDEVIERTNISAHKIFTRLKLRERTWKGLTRDEMYMLIGLILLMGYMQIDHINQYWKKNSLFKLDVFRNNMSFRRFKEVLRRLRFSDAKKANRTDFNDRLYKTRDVINSFNKRMMEIYCPGREIIFDESLLWRDGEIGFQKDFSEEYIKKAIKLSHLVTYPEGIIMKLNADVGSKSNPLKTAVNLLDGFLNVGHSVYVNSYYASYEFAKHLLDNRTYCTGIIETSRKTFPKEVKEANLKNKQSIARYLNGIMIAKWKDGKEICYISSQHINSMQKSIDEYGRVSEKPLPIYYNDVFMLEKDKRDEILVDYPFQDSDIKWPFKMFVHTLQLVLLNSYRLYNKYSGIKISLDEFRLTVIKCLIAGTRKVPDLLGHTLYLPEIKKGGKLLPRHCKSCYLKCKRKKDALYMCTVCEGSPAYCLGCVSMKHRK